MPSLQNKQILLPVSALPCPTKVGSKISIRNSAGNSTNSTKKIPEQVIRHFREKENLFYYEFVVNQWNLEFIQKKHWLSANIKIPTLKYQIESVVLTG